MNYAGMFGRGMSMSDAVYAHIKRQAEMFATPAVYELAVRLTADTPGATACPNYDPLTGRENVPTDPTCLGTGFILPAGISGPQWAGYVVQSQPFDCVVIPEQMQTILTPMGIQQFQQTTCIWPARASTNPMPKTDDVLIAAIPGKAGTARYVFAQVFTPEALGSQLFLYRAVVQLRMRDNIVYSIPPADKTGLIAGTWQ